MGILNRITTSLTALLSRPPRSPEDRRIPPAGRTAAGIFVTPDNCLRNPVVFACHRYLSQTFAQLPARVMRENPQTGVAERARNSPLNWVLVWRTSPEYAPFQFKETLLGWALLWGNGYAEIERDMAGRVIALHPIHPQRVQVERWTETNELVYKVSNETGFVYIEPASMFHLRGWGDGPYGIGIVEYAAQTIGWAQATELFGATFFGEGLNPAGIIESPRSLTLEGRENLRQELEAIHKGPRRSNRWAFLDAGMKMQKLSTEPDSAQFVETMQHQVEAICRFFGVPPHKVQHLLRATFCLPADVLVSSEFGPKRIADIKIGDRVWSVSPDGKMELKIVERSGKTGKSKILTIKTRGRTLRANAQHRVMVRREKMIPYVGGRGLYRVIDGEKFTKSWENIYVPAGELSIGDQLIAVDEIPCIGGRMAPTREATIPFMELLGHLIGDGFYFRDGRSQKLCGFGISHAENDDCTPHYVSAAEEVFKDVARFHPNRKSNVCGVRGVLRDPNTTIFHSVAAVAELDACGVVGVAKTKRVPEWIYTLDRDLQIAFLRGYLDSDGTVNKNGYIRFVSCNKDLMEDIRQLCMMVGMRCGSVFSCMRKSSFPGYPEKISAIYSLVCSDAIANHQLGSNDPMRKERLDICFANRRIREVPVYDYEKNRKNCGSGLRATSITSIEISEDEEDVYDLTVSDNHCFIANGVVVHNSNIESQAIEVVTDAITPWVIRFEQECNYKLFGQNRQMMFVKLDLKGLLRGAFKDRQEGLRVMRQNGIISADEWRELEDMGPIGEDGGGKKRIVQMAMTTLERVGEEPVAANPAPAPEPEEPEDNEQETPEEAESPDELDAVAQIMFWSRTMERTNAH